MKTKNVMLFAIALMLMVGGIAALPSEKVQKVSPFGSAQAAYNETSEEFEGEYSTVMESLEDVFELFTDIGTLLSLNIGSALSATIQIFLFTGMVLLPIAVVAGLVAIAVTMFRSAGRKF